MTTTTLTPLNEDQQTDLRRTLRNPRANGKRYIRSRDTGPDAWNMRRVYDLYAYNADGKGRIVKRGRTVEESRAWLAGSEDAVIAAFLDNLPEHAEVLPGGCTVSFVLTDGVPAFVLLDDDVEVGRYASATEAVAADAARIPVAA